MSTENTATRELIGKYTYQIESARMAMEVVACVLESSDLCAIARNVGSYEPTEFHRDYNAFVSECFGKPRSYFEASEKEDVAVATPENDLTAEEYRAELFRLGFVARGDKSGYFSLPDKPELSIHPMGTYETNREKLAHLIAQNKKYAEGVL